MKDMRRWNLQLFADGDGGEDANGDGTNSTAEQQVSEQEASGNETNGLDPLDVFLGNHPDSMAEFDRRIAKAVTTREASLNKKHQQALATAKAEAQKVAAMSAEQKHQYELEKLQAENKALKEAATRTELAKEAATMLKGYKIDATEDMIALVLGSDSETTKANVDKFAAIVQAQIKAAEVARATGSAPKKFKGNETELNPFERKIAQYN